MPQSLLSLQVLGKNVSYFLTPLSGDAGPDTWLLLPPQLSGDVSPKLSQEMLSMLGPALALSVRWVLVLVDTHN